MESFRGSGQQNTLAPYWGANRLPKKMVEKGIFVNHALLGTELETLATRLTENILAPSPQK